MQSTPEHRTWQSIKHGKALAAHSAENQHSPLNTENTPQHGTQQGAQKLTAEQTSHGDFTARAEHGHTEQSLAHATVHEHKHPVETSLEQNRIAEHTSQSRAQDSSTDRRAQLAHTPQSAISSQLGSKSRRQQEQQETQRAAAYSIAMHAAEQTSHDRAHVQGGTRNNTQHGRHTPATSSAEHGSTNTE